MLSDLEFKTGYLTIGETLDILVILRFILPINCILLMQLAELDLLQKFTAKLPPSQKQQRILAPALSNKCFFMSVTSSALCKGEKID